MFSLFNNVPNTGRCEAETFCGSYFKQKLGDLKVAVGAGVVKWNQAPEGTRHSS